MKTYLPTFQLQDSVATERATARDLASHRVGLPRHDMFWYNSPFSRREMFARLRYLSPSADFRVRWQYQSLMYLTLGLVTEQLSESTWESYLHDRLFTPLGMQRSSFSTTLAGRDDDVALPYKLWPSTHQPVRVPFAPTPFERDPIGPAGSIKSTVRELLPWLLLHLNKGQHGAQRLLSEAQLTQTHRPNMVIDDPILFPETPYKSYALGWFVEPYRGFSVLHHGGNIDGFSARLSFLPEEQIGVVILSNLEMSVLPTLLSYHLYDRLLGLEIRPWHERLQHQVALVQAMTSKRQEGGQATLRSEAPPAHPQEDYLGTFMHPGYGTVEIGQDAQGLTWTYNQISSPLTHRHYEIFDLVIARYDLRRIVSFTTNADGEVASLSANLEPTVPDIVFTRVAPVIEKAILERLMGTYEGFGQRFTITAQGETQLRALLPGLPAYELIPSQNLLFLVRGRSEVRVAFTLATEGQGVSVRIIQSNGTLTAQKLEQA